MFLNIFSTQSAVAKQQDEKLAQELWDIKQQIKELKKTEELYTDMLKLTAQGKTTTFGIFTFLLKSRKGSVQYGSIPELKNIDLDQYRGEEVQYFELHKA